MLCATAFVNRTILARSADSCRASALACLRLAWPSAAPRIARGAIQIRLGLPVRASAMEPGT